MSYDRAGPTGRKANTTLGIGQIHFLTSAPRDQTLELVKIMNKRDLMLIALAAGENAEHSPVQLQKLIFLIEKNIANRLGGTSFNFVPYDYGPFDSAIYDELRRLEAQGLTTSTLTSRGWAKHKLTDQGLSEGRALARTIDPGAAAYIQEISAFVRKLPFSDLVSAVYKAYPEMKVNSVFRG